MRIRPRGVRALVLLALITAPAVSAHHSVSGQFDVSKEITLKGVISRIDWQNPHIYVFLDVKDDAGAMTTWALETLPTAMMRRAGLTRDAVAGKPGELVTVVGNPGRDSTRSIAWIHRITYADGHYFQLAN
jgi:hypothetical protein